MELSKYDEKYIRVLDIYGETHIGVADYCSSEYCWHEYGEEEEGFIIGSYLVYASQIAAIEEAKMQGTVELRTKRLILRRYCLEDVSALYQRIGSDPAMYQYSGWNPYASEELAKETVCRFLAHYDDEHFYSWVMDVDDVLYGTIGAYDYHNNQIEVGFSVVRACWGRGYATEALKKVLNYLTENEGISCVTAWCASENRGSRNVLEKSGMKLVSIEKSGLTIGSQTYDKLLYEYRRQV